MRTEQRGAPATPGPLVEVFPLHMAWGSRVFAAIALLFVGPIALAAFGGALTGLVEGRFEIAAPVFLFALAAGWLARRIARELFPNPASLGISPNALVLKHPLLLKRDLEVTFDDVDRVVVRDSDSPGFWDPRGFTLEREQRGVAWIAGGGETVEALDATTRFMLPLASHVQSDEPNVAVVFRRPVDLRGLRDASICGADLAVRRLCDVEQAPGFLARVKDPEAVARAFGERRLLGKLTQEHEALLEPAEEDVKRYRSWRRRAVWARVVGPLLLARYLWDLLD